MKAKSSFLILAQFIVAISLTAAIPSGAMASPESSERVPLIVVPPPVYKAAPPMPARPILNMGAFDEPLDTHPGFLYRPATEVISDGLKDDAEENNDPAEVKVGEDHHSDKSGAMGGLSPASGAISVSDTSDYTNGLLKDLRIFERP